jgi:hypothetical protein
MPPTIRERLSALRNLARDGGNVDAGELAALTAEAEAEAQVDALRAEGQAQRDTEAAEREYQAKRAEAAAIARETMTDARAQLIDADQALRAAIATYAGAVDHHNGALHHVVNTLRSAGYPEHIAASHLAVPVHHKGFDENLLPIMATEGWQVRIDGTTHATIDAGHGAIWAVSREPRTWAWVAKWRRSRDTYPIQSPIPGIDAGDVATY